MSLLSFSSWVGLQPLRTWESPAVSYCSLLPVPWLTDNWFQKVYGLWKTVSWGTFCLWMPKVGCSLAKPWRFRPAPVCPVPLLKELRQDSHCSQVFRLPSHHHCHILWGVLGFWSQETEYNYPVEWRDPGASGTRGFLCLLGFSLAVHL